MTTSSLNRLLAVGLVAALALAACPGGVDPAALNDFGGVDVDARDARADALADGAGDTASDSTPDTTGVDLSADLALDLAPDATDDLGPPPPCVALADGDTLALYTFEGSGATVVDVTSKHPGQLVGSNLQRVPGQSGCGQALNVSGGNAYAEVPNSAAWELAEGSVDLWVRFDALADPPSERGVISRDALGTNTPGHFSVFRACDGAVIVRHQLGGVSHYLCSDPVLDETWVHVGVNFGAVGLELYVGGKAASYAGKIWRVDDSGKCVAQGAGCNTPSKGGIAGNSNPWVVGASAQVSDEGKATPASRWLYGHVDSVRISSARRSF